MAQEIPYVYINGELIPAGAASVPVMDRGLLYGDGCFDAMAVVNGNLFRYWDHRRRFLASTNAIGIERSGLRKELDTAIPELVRANELTDAYVKMVITRGAGDLPRITYDADLASRLIVYAVPRFKTFDGQASRDEVVPVSLATVSVRRPSPDTLDPRIKSLNYLSLVVARQQAQRAGADDALLLDQNGEVAEASIYNVFIAAQGCLLTPSSPSILRGITRSLVFEMAQSEGLICTAERLTLTDVYSADEVFLTSTGGGIIPVGSVDGRPIDCGGPGKITMILKRLYDEMQRDGADSLVVGPK